MSEALRTLYNYAANYHNKPDFSTSMSTQSPYETPIENVVNRVIAESNEQVDHWEAFIPHKLLEACVLYRPNEEQRRQIADFVRDVMLDQIACFVDAE